MRSRRSFNACSYLASHSCIGCSRSGSSLYSRRRPSARARTSPTSLRTRRCFETWGCDSARSSTIAPTAFSPPTSTSRIARRGASAIALKTSAVAAERATVSIYSHIGMCQVVSLRRAVHAQEPQAGRRGHRRPVRRRARPAVPRREHGARARALRARLPVRPARLSLSVRPHAQTAGRGLRRRAWERAHEGRRRDRRPRGVGRGARSAGFVARLRGGPERPGAPHRRRAEHRSSTFMRPLPRTTT